MGALKPGDFFRRRFKQDPSKLALHEINRIALKRNFKGVRSTSLVVVPRGSVFKCRRYDIESLAKTRMEKVCR